MPKKQNAIPAEIRRQEILELVNKEGRVTVNDLSISLEVSEATVRTDLTFLEKAGLLKRVHGSALSLTNINYELTTSEKKGLNIEAKRAIAKAARSFVAPGSVIAVDTGTTTIELIRQISDIPDVTIVTNDLEIALLAEERSSQTVILLGGAVRKHFHCTVGQSVINSLEALRISTCFIATNGIDPEWGLSTPRIDMAEVKSKFIKNSREVILLTDSSKFGKDSFARFGSMKDIDVLITDSAAPSDKLCEIEKSGTRVIKADTMS